MESIVVLIILYIIIKKLLESSPKKTRTNKGYYSENRWDLGGMTKGEQRELFESMKDRWGW